MMQSPTSRREPPCASSGSWQPLQAAVETTSRISCGAPPAGTKEKTTFATCASSSRVAYAAIVCVAFRS